MILNVLVETSAGTTVVYLGGSLNEESGHLLADLHELRGDRHIIDFRNIVHINSSGVRLWLNFARRFCAERDVVFRHCQPLVVSQIAMIDSFRGRAAIDSIYVVLRCDPCNLEAVQLVEGDQPADAGGARRLSPDLAAVRCPRCAEVFAVRDEDEINGVLEIMAGA